MPRRATLASSAASATTSSYSGGQRPSCEVWGVLRIEATSRIVALRSPAAPRSTYFGHTAMIHSLVLSCLLHAASDPFLPPSIDQPCPFSISTISFLLRSKSVSRVQVCCIGPTERAALPSLAHHDHRIAAAAAGWREGRKRAEAAGCPFPWAFHS